MMDITQLSARDVSTLIMATKYYIHHPDLFPLAVGKVKQTEIIIDKSHKLFYKFQIYRGQIENKYSLHIRFSANDQQIIRLCMNGSRHHNLDGSVVGRSHVHIYHPENNETYAYPLVSFPFGESDDLRMAIDKFTTYINLKLEGGY